MKKHLSNVSIIIGLLLTLVALPVSAHDRNNRLEAKLVPTEEVPVVSSQASGDFEARIQSDGSVSFKMSYEGLEGGPILFAHIHLGQKGVNGGIMAFLCNNTPAGPQPRPCPAGPATVEGTITAADILPLATQQVAAGALDEFTRALRNGTAYVNLHTTASPAGEIRGQVKVDRFSFFDHRRDDDDDRDH
jgi:CHRD domain